VAAYRAARDAEQQAHRDHVDAEQLRLQAMQADAQLSADALETDSEDPGTPNVDEADRRIASLGRRVEAAKLVTARRVGEVQAALDQYGGEWMADLQDEHDELCRSWQRALDDLIAQQRLIAGLRAVVNFTVRGRYSGPAELTPYIGQVPQIPADQAVAVLRVYGRPPEQSGEQDQTAA
jgi:hypothetical protein